MSSLSDEHYRASLPALFRQHVLFLYLFLIYEGKERFYLHHSDENVEKTKQNKVRDQYLLLG